MIAIVSIGYAYNAEVDEAFSKQSGLEAIGPAEDGSEFFPQYMLTSKGEPIAVTEYACDIAESPSTHLLQLDIC